MRLQMLHYDNYEKLEDILREHLFSLSVIGGVRVSACGPCCSFRFCVVLCLSSYCVLCTQYYIVSVSELSILDCPFGLH